ncbi:MAG: LysR family transcriptional regulator [Desulfobacteraceae bacterium]|nr:LysR family transcriptional regulator [Desulfobacteraceae bacterium]
MDLWQLQVFCKVIELKSFSKAGRAVHLSQPTVSSHIKDLEAQFNTRLIDRMSREALPTKSGELLYQYGKRLINLRSEAEAAMAEFQGQIKGELIVGASTIPGSYVLPRVIAGFTNDYPDVNMSLIIGDTQEIVDDILTSTIEVGVVGALSEDKNIRQAPLLEDELCLIVPKGHRWADRKSISVSALLNEPFVVREYGSGTLKSFEIGLKGNGFKLADLNIAATMGSNEAIRQAVKHGAGFAVVSRQAVVDDLASGALHAMAIGDLNLNRFFYLTTHANRSASPIGRTFVRFLKATLLKIG